MNEKIAVLKLAGFRVRKTDGLWEWCLSNKQSPDGQAKLGKESYAEEESAWDSAWRYIRGESWEEFDNEPWITPKESNT